MPTFVDFDIRIHKSGRGRYGVSGETRADGRAGPERLDWTRLNQPDLQEKLRRLQEEPFTLTRADFRQVGSELFASLFRGQALRLFTGLWDQKVQKRSDTYLRLRLDIDEYAPEIAVLPWELLYWRDAHLGTQIKTLVTRQLLDLDYGPIAPLTLSERPAVLVIIPSGSGLRTDEERQGIKEILTQAGFPFEVLEGEVTLLRLADTLARKPYPILHFIGHGDVQEDKDEAWQGMLRFNSPDGAEEWVGQERLQALLSSYASTTRLMVLNGCLGGAIRERRPVQPGRGFVGLAPALLKSGIPAVVAMQYEIGDGIAIQFARSFYQRLSSGQWAGHVDIAVSLARNDCFLVAADDRGFATPVIYLRATDGLLFDLSHPSATAAAIAATLAAKIPSSPEGGQDAEGSQAGQVKQPGSKYTIHIDSAQGLAIGDRAQVTQIFGGALLPQPFPSSSAAQHHLRQQLIELQARCETLSRRIAALDTDIGRELDAERKLLLRERRQELGQERSQITEEISRIEEVLGQ